MNLMCNSCESEPNNANSTTQTEGPVVSESSSFVPTGQVADSLVPNEGPVADSINRAYTKVVGALMALFNGGGPKLTGEFKISASQGRGIFIMAFTQMLGAISGTQFCLRPDQQHDLVTELNEVVKKHAARAALFLPQNQRMDSLVTAAVAGIDVETAKILSTNEG